MKYTTIVLCLFAALSLSQQANAQLPIIPLAPQAELLKSDNPKYAANKKLVYDMWREFIEARHMEVAEKYFKESYMQHNPNAKSGRQAVMDYISQRGAPQAICDTIKMPVVAIVAEGDLVVINFASERQDPNDASKTYTTTWFDMFRIEDGQIAEHWDSAEKPKKK